MALMQMLSLTLRAVKTNFEKKNQKTNALVLQLQKKLEKYHNTLVVSYEFPFML